MAVAWVFPGQGSQHRDMGVELFDRFPELTTIADAALKRSVRELCCADDGNYLKQTQHVQPAMYVVNALTYLSLTAGRAPAPDFLAGHSLGEYSALFAAGCVDFETGFRLVTRRGELMSQATGGGMVAVLGVDPDRLDAIIAEVGGDDVDLANHNLPEQLVLSGRQEALRAVVEAVRTGGVGKCVPLNVSIAAHSRFMATAAEAFAELLRDVEFAAPRIPVISNVTARPHRLDTMADLLCQHIYRPVRWWDTMCHLAEQGVTEVTEVGPGTVLHKLWSQAQGRLPAARPAMPPVTSAAAPVVARAGAERLGSAALRREYGLRYAYVAGSLERGVASTELLRRLDAVGLMGFHGTSGLDLAQIERALVELDGTGRYGMAWPANVPERAVTDLYLRHDVRHLEVGARCDLTPQLVRFRFSGAHRATGRPVAPRHLLARVADLSTAARFLRPPSEAMLCPLVHDALLTPTEAAVARELPVASDLAVAADHGWHAYAATVHTLLPAVVALRDETAAEVRVGVASGMGTPAAVAAAFVLGADFVMTTSVNQCSPQANTSDAVKELLASLDVPDTGYAPGAELFELGARSQVAKKGTLFAARAGQLHRIYQRHGGLDELDIRTRRTVEQTCFRRPLDQVWAELGEVERDAKHRMALVFASYCHEATESALRGVTEQQLNFRIPCGPDMGAFNRFVTRTELSDWRGRHVELIAEALMRGAAQRLDRSIIAS